MCVVPNAIEYRRLRTCQLAYYGRMGLGIKYRQIGRDELCTSGPNLELGGALVPPEKNKAKPREGCPYNSGDHGPIVLVIFLQECLG